MKFGDLCKNRTASWGSGVLAMYIHPQRDPAWRGQCSVFVLKDTALGSGMADWNGKVVSNLTFDPFDPKASK